MEATTSISSSTTSATTTSTTGSFASHLQSYIRFGEKFKAYPTCANHCFIPELINIIKYKIDIFKDILNIHSNSNGSLRGLGLGTQLNGYNTTGNPTLGLSDIPGDLCKYVLSVKVTRYPADICSCWIIIGQISPEDDDDDDK